MPDDSIASPFLRSPRILVVDDESQVREFLRYPQLPVVMPTGYGTAIEHQAQSRGIALLHKPVDAVELVRTIRNALTHAVG